MTTGSPTPTALLAALQLALPAPQRPKGGYVPAKVVDGLLWVAGHTDRRLDAPATRGVVGDDVSLDRARLAARDAALNLLAAAVTVVDLDDVSGVVSVRGYVRATPAFDEHPKVVDSASELFDALFGVHGAHTRAAIGVASLPGGACVELEAVFSLRR